MPVCLLTFPRLFAFSWVFMVLAWSTCGFLPDFSALGCRHLLMGRIDLWEVFSRQAVLWLALGVFSFQTEQNEV